MQVQAALGFPVVIRPSFTLGGSGGGIAYNREEFLSICERGFDASPTHELLVEESVIGWKEFEMEVVRDRKDNCIIVCSIENLDPMGVHTGDSITVAPAQTLTDKEYQIMRNASIAVLREIGVDTGGSNVQFAINPQDGRMVVIEMNPRVSRSSALASKATGFPDRQGRGQARRGLHARRAAQRHHRRRHAGLVRADHRLRRHQGAALRVREVPAGRPAPHHADEIGGRGDGDRAHASRNRCRRRCAGWRRAPTGSTSAPRTAIVIERELAHPGPERLWFVADAFRVGMTVDEVHGLTHIDPWFLAQIEDLVRQEQALAGKRLLEELDARALRELKRSGFSDRRLARLLGASQRQVRERRWSARRAPGVQAGRHLRRRVRHAHRLHVLHLRGGVRGAARPRARRSWCWAAGPTASARASSSTTAACTRRSRCARTGSRPSWSTATRRPSPPTTTPRTACTSSR